MLADLGGAVDLWVGMSVLAMIQCIEYLLELVHYGLCSGSKTSRQVSVQENLPPPANINPEPLRRKPLSGFRDRSYEGGQPYYDDNSVKLAPPVSYM